MTWRVVIFMAACGGTPEVPAMPSNHGQAVISAPDLTALRTLLDPLGRKPFSSVAVERGCPETPIGEYIQLLVTNGTTGTDRHELTGGCGGFPDHPIELDPPRDDSYWYCRIDSHVYGAEDPWHYELRVRVRKRDRFVDLATVACPGA